MKIGLVCPYNINKGGGVQEIVRDLRLGLMERGHEVKIITPQPRENGEGEPEGVIFLGGATDFRSPTHTTLQISASLDTDAIDEMLEREHFDILHFHEPWVPVASRQILSRSQAVNIATFHGVVPETLMSRTVVRVVTPYTKSILKYFHKLTAVSEAAALYARSLTEAPIDIVPNGIDLKRYRVPKSRSPASRKEKLIFYIGRLERRKGVRYLLHAYQILAESDPNISLVIAGSGPDREKLELLAEDMKLPNVSFLGYIDDATKFKLLEKADLFCSPAVYGESFGLVLLEAMASGLVTVAGNNSGYSSLMEGLGAVSIVNPHDEEEFARRMQLLLNVPSLRNLWQQWAKDFVQQYDYPHIIDRYEKLYKDALKHHG